MLTYCDFCKLTLRACTKQCCRFETMSSSNELSRNTNVHPESVNYKKSDVAKFYSKKSVFLTGSTGFLGMMILEKLLYSCEDMKQVYVLIRQKKGKNIKERLDQLLESSAFERIKDEKPQMLKKIVAVAGDISEPDMGMSPEDQARLFKEVSIVLHVAANISFGLRLKNTLTVNTNSSQNIMNLTKKMPLLQAFVYVSTAYSFGNRDVVAEKIYPLSSTFESYYYMADHAVESNLMKNINENRPNMYTVSKALAEYYIDKEKGDIPTAIVRPSVIISSVRDPSVGWVEGLNGATGVIAAVGQGLLRSWYGDAHYIADLVPVDVVGNLTIVAAMDASNRYNRGDKDLKVFNCCSGLRNPINVKQFLDTSLHFTRKYSFDGRFLYPTLVLTTNHLLHTILIFFLQTLPAILVDKVSWLLGKKPRMMKLQMQLSKLASVLEFFTWHQYIFIDHNVHSLYESLTSDDKRIFDFNIGNFTWTEYLEKYVFELRNYLCKVTKRQQSH